MRILNLKVKFFVALFQFRKPSLLAVSEFRGLRQSGLQGNQAGLGSAVQAGRCPKSALAAALSRTIVPGDSLQWLQQLQCPCSSVTPRPSLRVVPDTRQEDCMAVHRHVPPASVSWTPSACAVLCSSRQSHLQPCLQGCPSWRSPSLLPFLCPVCPGHGGVGGFIPSVGRTSLASPHGWPVGDASLQLSCF